MAVKKTELYSSLWASCDELRGGMDASQYKDYVLTLLFMKYVSDKYAGDPYGLISVPEGGSFRDMVALKGDKEIGDKINKIISALAEENNLKGVIDVADFNDEDRLGKGKEMVDRLSNLVAIFDGIDLSANRAEGDDLLGDAYEYLMRHFATESGKSKGQFYTPAEVSRVLAKVVGITADTRQDQTVYDPTCGSGSLLLKNGDIDVLQPYWEVFPALRKTLFTPSDRPGYSESLVEASQVKATILNHPEFVAFASRALALYTDWYKAHEAGLKAIAIGDKPKALIEKISEDLLTRFADAHLLSRYDIYQLLMDYWAETMQDDVYVLVQDGWAVGKVLRELVVKKGEKLKETPDLVIDKKKYKADLIPPGLIVARYFADKQTHIDELQADLDAISQELEALMEEHGGEEGLLADAQTDAGKVTKASVAARLKELKGDAGAKEEVSVLKQCLTLFDQEAEAKKAVKESQAALDEAVFAQYPKLTEDDIKTLVVDDKWQATLKAAISAEIERVTQQLANRVKTLEERYAEPLPQLVQDVEVLSSRVEEHLKNMGLVWD